MIARLRGLTAYVGAGLAVAALPTGTAPIEAARRPPASAPSLPVGLDSQLSDAAFASTYRPLPGRLTAITGATILTGAGEQIENATILFDKGRILALGGGVKVPPAADVVDGRGKWVTPGIIDVHAHLGVDSSPQITSLPDINETSDPNQAQVWVEHSIWPQDPGFSRALEGGVTTMQILPGSYNLFGGRSVVIKNVPATTVQAMKFPGAPQGLKMACGENPKRTYGSKGRFPVTRMGEFAGYRAAWINARAYAARWDKYRADAARGTPSEAPKRDLQLDTLADALRGKILVQTHCYRAEEMAAMLGVAREFGYRIAVFHHAVEAYKIPELLADNKVCIATWADWLRSKMEAYDHIPENAAIVHRANVCVIIHSDNPIIMQHLNQEAAIAMAAGNRAGLGISRAEAIAWITSNPAKGLGIEDRTGSLEPGKMADLILWDRDPFSVYARTERVYVDGGLAYDRDDPHFQPRSDFELGIPRPANAR